MSLGLDDEKSLVLNTGIDVKSKCRLGCFGKNSFLLFI
jgi:hypothetical protein